MKSPLSKAETKALIAYLESGSYKRAAAELEISPKTMDKHMTQVHKKLYLYNFELVHYAISNKLIPLQIYDPEGGLHGTLKPTLTSM